MRKSFIESVIIAAFVLFSASICAADTRYRGMSLAGGVGEQDIIDLAGWKANLVRYQLIWNGADTAGEAEYMAWLDSALDRFDSLVPLFEQMRMKVVLDLHSPPGGLATHTTPAQQRIFSEKWAQDAFITAWQKISTREKGKAVLYGYDILNEPAFNRVSAGLRDWNGLAAAASSAIRAIDKSTPIIVKPPYGNPSLLSRLRLPKVKKVILSIHEYYTLNFIQQGLYGYKMGVKYPYKKFNKGAINSFLAKAVNYQRKHRVWKVYVGEFTVARWAPGSSGANYLRDVISIFEKNRWDWTYHIWREADVWSLEIGSDPNVTSPSPALTDRAKVVRAYLSKNK